MPNTMLFPALLLLCATSAAGDDLQYWSALDKKLYQQHHTSLKLYAEARFNQDVSRAQGYFGGLLLRHKLNANLSLGLGVKQVFFKINDHFRRAQRYEAEFTLAAQPFSWLKLKDRNRYEYFRWDGFPDRKRLRNRLSLSYPRATLGPFSLFYTSIEWFYQLGDDQFRENRLVPLAAVSKLSPNTKLTLFSLIQHRRGGDNNYVLGSVFSF